MQVAKNMVMEADMSTSISLSFARACLKLRANFLLKKNIINIYFSLSQLFLIYIKGYQTGQIYVSLF